ncbi:type II secretion system protein [Helicobacter fennelliae]|uniref:Uncharacterized protein n=2 Tax=Helicobacter fennelliae TaxID=215 RepID=T1CRR7_9HELI|nr:prepilin-type N-terminal cleavage/methylation domain-containing protein [Helicobacter fennelliae]GAD19444.1 hypothetical protein HFN_0575 [Helicobacter fennelliae MRY12-0050]SQB97554.1 Tfp pilus assembly protein PilE [Helicobacter fennelliae]STP06965.1 Tfp pilus assembly protein PilE [Helicobacter fennelliae]STQ83488.1 Tfp pilus assembly protein PilE [Helicobacter fennelliae]
MHDKSKAFSLIELVFVIAVIGILAAIAIPKLTATRSDAQYVAINSDMQTIISSIQAHALTTDLGSQTLNGALIMQVAGLSPSRWIASTNGVRLAKNGAIDTTNNCVSIDITNLHLIVSVQNLPNSPLCVKLAKNYPTPLNINLANTTF